MLLTAHMYMYLKLFDKRSQHANNVAMCCNMLGIFGSSLEMVKFEPNAHNMLHRTML